MRTLLLSWVMRSPSWSAGFRVYRQVMHSSLILLVINLLPQVWASPDQAGDRSFYTERLSDDLAVYLTPEAYPVVGDGLADDSDGLQLAINAVQEKMGYGILYIPEGRYRLTRTLFVWKGIRLIGYGQRRPVLLLGDNTPGFQEGEGNYLVNFVSDRPRGDDPIRPANPGTFYSAISNIDIEMGEGNPAAIGVRSHFAQHCYLAHMDFRIGSGRAGVEKVGNEIDDCRFYGGDYGIITTKPSPSWPFVMVDSVFEGQRVASIQTEEGGLTLLRIQFRDVPSAIVVNPDRAEELFLADSRLENISGPAIIISDEHNARPQFNLLNVAARNVPILAGFRRSGREVPGPAPIYLIEDFTHGLQIEDLGADPEVKTSHRFKTLDSLPDPVLSDIPALPPQGEWVNVKTQGVIGDGEADDTEAIGALIDQHRALFFPSGRYRVTDTIRLKPDTVLIGLNPTSTQILIRDHTPAFMGGAEIPKPNLELIRRWGLDETDEDILRRFTPPLPPVAGPPVPMIEAPRGGTNIITGIGLDTGGANPGAVALKWMAGARSLVNDVRFVGGHGTYELDGSRVPIYNDNRSADPDPARRWDSQYPSLWVTDGGGGTFKDIWTPSPFAQAGMRITNTNTEGRVYQVSSEHHVRAEIQLSGVSNWRFFALQFEEESGEGPDALPLEIENCSDLLFANTYLYRVDRMVKPYPFGVRIRSSQNLDFRGLHVYSPTRFSYDNTLYDETHDFEIRSREIARLSISGKPPSALEPSSARGLFGASARLEKLAVGFEFIDGAAVDSKGNVYFVDGRRHRIYRWSVGTDVLKLISDASIEPVALGFDQSDNLIVLTRAGKLLSRDPDSLDEDWVLMVGQPAENRPGMVALLPGHRWRDAHDILEAATAPSRTQYLSPDHSTYVTGLANLRRTFSLRRAIPGQPYYLVDEFGQKTWRFSVQEDGSLTDPILFAEEGESGLAVDASGHVFVAAGQVFVYNPQGKRIGRIDIPERPAALVLGGENHRDLYICARSSLYRLRAGE